MSTLVILSLGGATLGHFGEVFILGSEVADAQAAQRAIPSCSGYARLNEKFRHVFLGVDQVDVLHCMERSYPTGKVLLVAAVT